MPVCRNKGSSIGELILFTLKTVFFVSFIYLIGAKWTMTYFMNSTYNLCNNRFPFQNPSHMFDRYKIKISVIMDRFRDVAIFLFMYIICYMKDLTVRQVDKESGPLRRRKGSGALKEEKRTNVFFYIALSQSHKTEFCFFFSLNSELL